LPHTADKESRAANEILRAIFSAMIDAGMSQAEFAEKIDLSERTIEKWRSSSALKGDAKGPGLVLIIRALHALGLELDVRAIGEGSKRFPLSVRTDLAELERHRARSKLTDKEWQERSARQIEDARRKGIPTDGWDRDG
jgi:transcriptional regulator with XRE-family HTH domain